MEPQEFLQSEWEFNQVLAEFRRLQPMRILEIGVKHGGTLALWIENAPKGASITAVDECRQANVGHEAGKYALRHGVGLHFYCGDSHNKEIIDLANQWGPFDWVFIDGDHSYEGVKQDYENYPGSVVAFHDIHPHHTKPDQNGAVRLWREIKLRTWRYDEFIEDTKQSALGIGIVYNQSCW